MDTNPPLSGSSDVKGSQNKMSVHYFLNEHLEVLCTRANRQPHMLTKQVGIHDILCVSLMTLSYINWSNMQFIYIAESINFKIIVIM